MKLQEINRQVDMPEGAETKQFTVKAGAHIMTVLSGLYQNPVDAIVREYLTNMHDAYVALRKRQPDAEIIPPKLHAPSTLEPELVFEDFGIGMSRQTVWNVYSTYGESTKNDSNDEVGGFGLGSKTAFCYNRGSNWMIESRFEGMKHVFMAYVNKDGIPELVHLSSAPTDEHSGVTIRIPILKGDIDSCQSSIKKYIEYFPMDIEVTGMELKPQTEMFIQEPNFAVRKNISSEDGNDRYNSYYRRDHEYARIVMGNVPYPMSPDMLYKFCEDCRDFLKALGQANLRLDIILPIGAVDIVPSRDAIKNTEESATALHAALEQIRKDLGSVLVESHISSATEYSQVLNLITLARDLDIQLSIGDKSNAGVVWTHPNGLKLYYQNPHGTHTSMANPGERLGFFYNVEEVFGKSAQARQMIQSLDKKLIPIDVFKNMQVDLGRSWNRVIASTRTPKTIGSLYPNRLDYKQYIVYNDTKKSDKFLSDLMFTHNKHRNLVLTPAGNVSRARGAMHSNSLYFLVDSTKPFEYYEALFTDGVIRASEMQTMFPALLDSDKRSAVKKNSKYYILNTRNRQTENWMARQTVTGSDRYYMVLRQANNGRWKAANSKLAEYLVMWNYQHANPSSGNMIPVQKEVFPIMTSLFFSGKSNPIYGIRETDLDGMDMTGWTKVDTLIEQEFKAYADKHSLKDIYNRIKPDFVSYGYARTGPGPAERLDNVLTNNAVALIIRALLFDREGNRTSAAIKRSAPDEIQKLARVLEYLYTHLDQTMAAMTLQSVVRKFGAPIVDFENFIGVDKTGQISFAIKDPNLNQVGDMLLASTRYYGGRFDSVIETLKNPHISKMLTDALHITL